MNENYTIFLQQNVDAFKVFRIGIKDNQIINC